MKAASAALLWVAMFPLGAQVKRLAPAAFPELPKNVAAELNRRGCIIPQPYPEKRANVIRGAFKKPGQTDWAVLCAAGEFSSILVFWNGSERDPAEAAKWREPDENAVYDFFIRPVGRKFILIHYKAYGGPKPPPIDHQGIESGGEKASEVLYYYRGEWLKLQGAD
ncbi:MAG TPA: hypothetical protein VEV17_07195 [Bryobacteraceae bacterium]|nr:hypothetical protein [Bryobacteraceae bacterium]